jgi:hypothetical protein
VQGLLAAIQAVEAILHHPHDGRPEIETPPHGP